MLGSPLLVVSIFWLGWSGNYPSVPWYVPGISTIFVGTSISLIFMSFLVCFKISIPCTSLNILLPVVELSRRYLPVSLYGIVTVQSLRFFSPSQHVQRFCICCKRHDTSRRRRRLSAVYGSDVCKRTS